MINCDYKVSIKDIQNKYKFKIFATGGKYDDSDLRKMIESVFYALPRVNGAGTSISLNDTAFSYMKNKLYATETSQDGTPTPNNPQQIHTVTGDNEVVVCGKNLFNLNDLVKGRLDNGVIGYANGTDSITISGDTLTFVTNSGYRGVSTNSYIGVEPSTSYYMSYTTSSSIGITMACYDSTKTFIGNATAYATTGGRYYDTLANTSYIRLNIQLSNVGTCTMSNIQFEKGSITTYEPYQGQNYPLYLGDKEICKIGNYENKIFKAIKGNEIYDSLSAEEKNTLYYGKWYLHKEIGKVVLNGSETWTPTSLSSTVYRFQSAPMNLNAESYVYQKADGRSNYFNYYMEYSGDLTNERVYCENQRAYIITSVAATENDFKTWLSTHNTIVYYVLATPTNELFNDTIGEQLEDIYNNMLSYEGQTNISQVNNDLPFIIDATAMYDLSNLIPAPTTLSLNRLENTNINPTLEVSGLDVPLTLNKTNIEDEPVELNADEDIEEVENTEEEPKELDVLDTPIELNDIEEEPTEE